MLRKLTCTTPHGVFTRTTHRPYRFVGVGWWPHKNEPYAVWSESEAGARKNLRTMPCLGVYPVDPQTQEAQ